jgi:hypothetical protein
VLSPTSAISRLPKGGSNTTTPLPDATQTISTTSPFTAIILDTNNPTGQVLPSPNDVVTPHSHSPPPPPPVSPPRGVNLSITMVLTAQFMELIKSLEILLAVI